MRVKALEDFRFFNNEYGEKEITAGEEFEINKELGNDFKRLGLVEEIKNPIFEKSLEKTKKPGGKDV
ncbi:MAG: hypothetical protein GX452_04445 [Ignavibacteriales bacterium]|nr:hypothetical protein [Ignavibacteriales bacterium]